MMNTKRNWLAFRTKHNHEKRLTQQLVNENVLTYCPLIRDRRRWADRWRTIERPLIPRIVFAYVSEIERIQVLEHPSVSSNVMYLGKPGVIKEEEIEAMKLLLDQPATFTVQAFNRSDNVRVDSGLFKGAFGTVLSHKHGRVKIRLESLGLVVTASLNPLHIKKVAKP